MTVIVRTIRIGLPLLAILAAAHPASAQVDFSASGRSGCTRSGSTARVGCGWVTTWACP